MDFKDSPSEAQFRVEVKEWLAANAPKFSTEGRDARNHHDDSEALKRAKEWQAVEPAPGSAGLTWPTEAGGWGR